MQRFFIENEMIVTDDEDFVFVQLHGPWRFDIKGYVISIQDNDPRHLHKIIANLIGLKGKIDHKDRNKKNNQRNNLREATNSQNGANAEKRRNNKSGFKGVYYREDKGMYQAQIMINRKCIYLGLFLFAEEAAKIRDEAALHYFGEFAVLNFPKEQNRDLP